MSTPTRRPMEAAYRRVPGARATPLRVHAPELGAFGAEEREQAEVVVVTAIAHVHPWPVETEHLGDELVVSGTEDTRRLESPGADHGAHRPSGCHAERIRDPATEA